MIASQLSHSEGYECVEERSSFLERMKVPSLYAKDGSSKQKVISLKEDIIWIEGTLSVTF